MAQRSLAKRAWYNFLHVFCRLVGVTLFRVRVRGRQYEVMQGGVLVLSNHQSHLDPVLVGIACQRRLNYLARLSLFRFSPFRWLIQSLDAIPIDREGSALSGLKETLKRLKHAEPVLIFPEGTRTRDGEIARLKPGFLSLVRRGKVPVLPIGIEGAYDCWPRKSPLPRLGVIHVQIGEPISVEQMAALNDDQLLAEVERRLRTCHALARRYRDRVVPGARKQRLRRFAQARRETAQRLPATGNEQMGSEPKDNSQEHGQQPHGRPVPHSA